MKKIVLSILVFLPLFVIAQTPKTVVVNIVDKESTVPYMAKSLLKSGFINAFANASDYALVDREADLSQMQRAGETGSEPPKVGADLILTVDVSAIDDSSYYISTKMMDLETGMIVATVSDFVGSSTSNLEEASKQMPAKLLEMMKDK